MTSRGAPEPPKLCDKVECESLAIWQISIRIPPVEWLYPEAKPILVALGLYLCDPHSDVAYDELIDDKFEDFVRGALRRTLTIVADFSQAEVIKLPPAEWQSWLGSQPRA